MKFSYGIIVALLCGAAMGCEDAQTDETNMDMGTDMPANNGVKPDGGGTGNGFGSCSDPCPPDVDVIEATCQWTADTQELSASLVFRNAINLAPDESAVHELSVSNSGTEGDEVVMRISVRDSGPKCDGFLKAGSLKAGGQAVFPPGAFECASDEKGLTITMDTTLVTGPVFGTPFVLFDIYSSQKNATGMRLTFAGPNGDPIVCDEI